MQYPFAHSIHQNGGIETEDNVSTTTGFDDHNSARLSGSFTHRKRLWLDNYGLAKIWYLVGKTTQLNTEAALKTVVETVLETAKLWNIKTDGCIQFVKLLPDACSKPENLDHGAIHIDTFEAKCCSAYFGSLYGQEHGAKKCQEMCIDKRGCTHIEIEKLISNTLGLLSPINRPDRDDYIVFHPELLSDKLWPPLSFNAKPRWLSMQKCSSSAVSMDVPVPYDFLSTLHPITSHYSESMGDPQGVIVTQDGTKQYLLDHRHAACPELSHFDLYQVYKAYGCDKKFAQDCKGTPPKCLNYGYLKKDCTCACPKHFGGSRCEKKIDDISDSCFGNAWFLNVNASGLYNTTDLGMHLNQNSGPSLNTENHLVKFMQFLTVSVQLSELGKHVSVALNHTAMQTLITKLQSKLSYFMDNINMTECDMHTGGSALYWGASLSKHIRSWCFSSLFLNEPSPIILRSRVPQTLDLVFRSSLGIVTEDAQLSIDVLQFQLEVSSFGVMNVTRHDSGDAGGSRSSGGGHKKSIAETLMAAGAGGIIGAVLMGVLLLAVIGGVAAWMWSRGEEEEEDSDYSDYSSDESEGGETAGGTPETGGVSEDGDPAAEKTGDPAAEGADTAAAGETKKP